MCFDRKDDRDVVVLVLKAARKRGDQGSGHTESGATRNSQNPFFQNLVATPHHEPSSWIWVQEGCDQPLAITSCSVGAI